MSSKKITILSLFTALSVVLSVLGVNLPVLYFIRLDFSEIPAILASFMLKPMCGVYVLFIKNIFLFYFSKTLGVGELSNFLLQGIFVMLCGIFKKRKFLGFGINLLISSIFNVFINYFVLYPLFFKIVSKESILYLYKSIFSLADNLFLYIILINLPIFIIKNTVSYLIAGFIYDSIKKTRNTY